MEDNSTNDPYKLSRKHMRLLACSLFISKLELLHLSVK